MAETHTIDANTEQRAASRRARYGDRYYPVDESYDKRVYENDAANYAKIVSALIGFWAFNTCHWLGILSLGIVDADALAYYSIAAFFFTVLFLAGLLTSGKYANRKKRFHEFLYEKISELESEAKGKEAAKKQAAEHAKQAAEQWWRVVPALLQLNRLREAAEESRKLDAG